MIKYLDIENFKCFEKKRIPLNKITILAGINGVGKSTVIQSLILLRQAFYEFSFSFSRRNQKIKLNDYLGLALGNSKNVTSSHTYSDLIILKAKHFKYGEFGITINCPTKTPEISVDFSYIKGEITEIENSAFSGNNFHYLIAERIGPRLSQSISETDFVNTGCAGEFTGYAMYKSQNIKLDDSKCYEPNKNTQLFSKQVEAWMDLIVPGVEFNSQLFEKTNNVTVGIRKRSSGTDFLSPSNIGFGISYVLPIVVSGLLANKDGMLIVENPEAHLHPSGQSKIGFFLAKIANSGVQVIIETHSEHIINGVRLASINDIISNQSITVNFFSQAEDGLSEPILDTIQLNENADLEKWPRGFFDQQQQDLAALFKKRREKKQINK